jgi:hypothetical protein
MDNCSIHKNAAIEALITNAGARLIYLMVTQARVG